MRSTLALIAAAGLAACGASDLERSMNWTELEGWASHQAESLRIEGVIGTADGVQGWVVEGEDGRTWVLMSIPEDFRLPTLPVQADVRLRPDLLSLGMPGELVEVLRIRPAPADRTAEEASPVMDTVDESPSNADVGHALWGEWRIVGHVAPGVSAISEARAAGWRGRAVEYAETFARSPNGECLEPTYFDRSESVDALMSGEFGVPASSVPLVADLDVIDVVDVRCADSAWGAAGQTVLLLDQRRALAPWDGAFFELRRTR